MNAAAERVVTSPTARWVRSGLALLVGETAPLLPRRDYGGWLQTVADEARLAAGADLDLRLFTERAAELGLSRRGQTSANGTARMIEAQDGWIVANLARADDRDAFPAWIGAAASNDPWTVLQRATRRRPAADLVAAGQELGVPVARVGDPADEQTVARGAVAGARVMRMAAGRGEANRRPLVIDLSSLWAGPLCAHILTRSGARVVKVESSTRPDAARAGPPVFFDRLHQGQESVALDFTTAEGRAWLARLIARADVVIESSRPRALEQLGIDLDATFAANPAQVWISLTAYGRTGPWRNRVGFGDDAAAAGGLVAWTDDGRPLFVGDALADPVAGVLAATAALNALAQGGGVLVDTALREAAALVAQAPTVTDEDRGAVSDRSGAWRWSGDGAALTPPLARDPPARPAPAFGAQTAAVLAELT